MSGGLTDRLVRLYRRLARSAGRLSFDEPVTHVYNPLVYAQAPFETYLARFARRGVDALLVGINPGPFGMAQTGIPFGEIAAVRHWMRVDGPIGRPRDEHPRRPVLGWECPRSEVSGRRLWGWARERFGTPERFFARFFVANYCPLLFLERSGRNRTPDRLPSAEREPLFAACDAALRDLVDALRPRRVLGIGRFAESRARIALASTGLPVGMLPHPSPASPAANRGWRPLAERALAAAGVRLEARSG